MDMGSDVPIYASGDEMRLSQVVTNLLSNAVKFTPEKGSIHLNVRNLGDDGNETVIEIEVTDSGIGITPEQQTKLFTSFEQADGGIARKFGGTGLGLAISKKIVELMGGQISVKSEYGSGSTFVFTVRLRNVEGGMRTQKYSRALYENLRVLVIDDDFEVLDYFKRVMCDFSIKCDTINNGRDALDKVRVAQDEHAPYDIIFIDYMMEDMDGIETTRYIRDIAGETVKVIMVSATEWNLIEDEARAAGVQMFIQKPLFQSPIFNAINELVFNKGSVRKPDMGPETMAVTYSHCRILLAEDIEINREIAITLLEDTKIQIDCAEDGEQALRMFSETPDYDLILMDVQMPLMDGLEATRRIRASGAEQAKSVPIVAMTANAFAEDIEVCRQAGMDDHIGKPIDMDVLLAKLYKYLCDKRD